jgi:drug/metabolite transporter (DMT)-like permease
VKIQKNSKYNQCSKEKAIWSSHFDLMWLAVSGIICDALTQVGRILTMDGSDHTKHGHPNDEHDHRPGGHAHPNDEHQHAHERTEHPQQQHLPTRAIVMSVISALLFGAATPCSKPLLQHLSPLQLAGLMYLGSALAMTPSLFQQDNKLPWQLDMNNKKLLATSLLLGGTVAPAFLMFGLRLAKAGSVSIWLNLELVFTTIIACVFFREHLSKRGWLAIFMAFAASILVGLGEGSAGLTAIALVAGACLCWSIDSNCTSIFLGLRPAQVAFWKGLVAGSVNLALGLIFQPFIGSLIDVFLCLTLGAFSIGVSIVLWVSSSRVLGATRGAMLFSSAPYFGLFLAAFWLKEGLSPVQMLAAIILAVAIAMLLTDSHQHEHTHETMVHTHEHPHDDAHHNHFHEGQLPSLLHTHEHEHKAITHSHFHLPDLHHRHLH